MDEIRRLRIFLAGESIFTPAIKETVLRTIDEQPTVGIAPENKPLTLDQLRQMDDEPVWVCGIPGHEIKWTPGWRIIDGNRVALRQWNDAVMYLYFADYGRTWLAYARKPEQEGK